MNQFFLRHRTALGLSLTAYILGFLNTFSYAPYHFWMIPFATLSGFLLLLAYAKANSETTKHVKKISFIFGVGWFSGGVSWVHVSIATFGGLPLIGSLSLIGFLAPLSPRRWCRDSSPSHGRTPWSHDLEKRERRRKRDLVQC